MKEYGVQPTSAMYTAIIESHAESYNIEPALRTYLRMKRENIVLELSAAQVLVNFLASNGYARLAFEVATEYEEESARSISDHIWSEVLASAAKNLDVSLPSPSHGFSSSFSIVRHYQESLGACFP